MLEYLKKYERNSILGSLLIVLVSILVIVKPTAILTTVILSLGIIAIVDGLIHVISYMGTSKEVKTFSQELFEGFIEIIAGICLISFRNVFISMVPIVIGIWIILKSILKFQLALNLKAAEEKNWISLLIVAIITLILGIIIIANPFKTAVTITIISGVFLLITAISDLIESFYVIDKLK